MNIPLKGIIPPLVTPLKNYGRIDHHGLKNLLEYLLSGGVHGIFILGTTGEGPSLSIQVRKELIRETGKILNHRIPFLVGITDTSIEASIELCQYAAEHGADAVVVAPPYYFPLNSSEVIHYFRKLKPELPLPFYLYNIPSHTKISLTLETIQEIKDIGASGVKDSSGDLLFLQTVIERFKEDQEFSVFTGTELFLPETLMAGGHGAIAGGANIFPELFVRFYEASLNNDLSTINHLREKVLQLYTNLYKVSNSPSGVTLGIKCTLEIMGFIEGNYAPPLVNLTRDQKARIKAYISRITE